MRYRSVLGALVLATLLTSTAGAQIVDFSKYTSIPQVGEKWLAVVAASDSRRGHDSRWLS